jgi:hypothetical protein
MQIQMIGIHQGELLNFNSRGDVTYSGKKQHVASVSFEHNGDLRNFNLNRQLKSFSSPVWDIDTTRFFVSGVFNVALP